MPDYDEIDRLEKQKAELEQKLKEQDKKHAKDIRQWNKNVKTQEKVVEELKGRLKEKEQENRISKLKLKELQKKVKHNQLKPIEQQQSPRPAEATEEAIVIKSTIPVPTRPAPKKAKKQPLPDKFEYLKKSKSSIGASPSNRKSSVEKKAEKKEK